MEIVNNRPVAEFKARELLQNLSETHGAEFFSDSHIRPFGDLPVPGDCSGEFPRILEVRHSR